MNTLSCIVEGGGLHFEDEKGMNATEGISYFQATKIIKEYF